MSDRPKGPFGIDPLHFSVLIFSVLILFVLYLLLPKAFRKQYFHAYPKRHAWSARVRARRAGGRSQVCYFFFWDLMNLELSYQKDIMFSIGSSLLLVLCQSCNILQSC